MYCSSLDRGRGCRYGPHKVHFHIGDGTRCCYCGSTDFGRGCKVNPIGDLHVHGANFGESIKGDIQSFVDNEILLRELKKDFKEFEAYKLKVIDECGNKIKTPITEEEKSAFSPVTRTIIRLKKFLGPKLDLLEASTSLEKQTIKECTDIEKYKKIMEYRLRVEDTIDELYEIISMASADGLSLEEVKEIIRA